MIWDGEVFVINWRLFRSCYSDQLKNYVAVRLPLAVWLTVKRKCWISFWLATIPLAAGPPVVGSPFSYLANFWAYDENGLCNKHDCRLNVDSFIFHDWIIFQNLCNVKRKPLFYLLVTLCTRVTKPAFWLPVSSSHLISVHPNWQRHATKKVRSFIPCHFIIFGERSDPPRICESQTSVISVPARALADRAIYSARVSNIQNGGHKTQSTRDKFDHG